MTEKRVPWDDEKKAVAEGGKKAAEIPRSSRGMTEKRVPWDDEKKAVADDRKKAAEIPRSSRGMTEIENEDMVNFNFYRTLR